MFFKDNRQVYRYFEKGYRKQKNRWNLQKKEGMYEYKFMHIDRQERNKNVPYLLLTVLWQCLGDDKTVAFAINRKISVKIS